MELVARNWAIVEIDKFGKEFIDFARIDLLGLLYRSVFDEDTPAKERARQAAYLRCATIAGIAA